MAFHLSWISFAIVAAITKREWFHKVMSVTSLLTFLVYIALLFTRLR